MAKPLGPKSLLIRQAITAHPDKGNTDLAKMLSSAPERKANKIKVSAQDVAAQRQAMKKPGATATLPPAPAPAAEPAPKAAGNGRQKPGRKPGRKPAAAATRPAATSSSSPVDLIDKTFALAQECGGLTALKKLVDRLADVQRW